MVERRPGLTVLSHLILVLGVAIVAFPLYMTFIASTQTAEQIATSMPIAGPPARDSFCARSAGVRSSNSSRGRLIVSSGEVSVRP